MRFSKFSVLMLAALISTPSFALERFSSHSCLEANYKTKITHRGPLFGLLPHELVIEKKNCLIAIKHRRYLPKEWVIDVCREPVHIKVTSATGVDVAKKTEKCLKPDKSKDTSDFCAQFFDLTDILQDDGLIFAEGDRDSLATPHGRTYCAYLLMERYLTDEVLFSRYTDVPEIFESPSHAPVPPTAPGPNAAFPPGTSPTSTAPVAPSPPPAP